MADKQQIPATPPKSPVVKVQTPVPVVKPGSMPGKAATLMRIQDSLDRLKKKN
jgi:hypothetical protein